MVTVKKAPEDLNQDQINTILNSIFNGDIYYSNQALVDKLNVSIKEVDEGYQVLVMRSQNQPWDRKYTPVVETLLPTRYNNGWYTTVSASILNSEIIQEFNTESNDSNLESEDCTEESMDPNTESNDSDKEVVSDPIPEKLTPNTVTNVGDPIINSFLEKGFDICQAGELAKGVKAGLDISSYEKLDMPWTSMLSHRLYLERHKGYK